MSNPTQTPPGVQQTGPVRSRHVTEPGREGWALTLADMMTLLMTFFVLMLAVAEIDPVRFRQVAENLSETMGGESAVTRGGEEQSAYDIRMSVEERQKNLFELQLDLARMVGGQTDAVDLALRPDAVAINLKPDVFFSSGRAELTGRAKSILATISPALVNSRYFITVEGHTDDIPILTDHFPSNWELSAARASSVARFLIQEGLPKERIRVMGLADTRPILPNRDEAGNPIPENQARNRRVTVLVHPKKEEQPKVY